jgi:hypothetical protein
VQVLVVETHEGQLNAFELAFGDDLALVAARHNSPTFCQSASVGEPMPTPGYLQDFGADIVLRKAPVLASKSAQWRPCTANGGRP